MPRSTEAEQFAATSADRRVLGLNYTLRLADTSLARFDLMLHDRLAFGGTDEEVSRFRSVLEPNDAGMLVSRRKDFNGQAQAGVLFHPEAPTTDEVYRLHARAQRLMTIYAGAVVPPLDSMWMLTRDLTTVIYMPRDPDFIYRATTGNNYLESEWITLGDPKTNPERALRWTHAIYDPVLRTWIVSAVRPFDLNGAWIGTIGHDLFVGELVQRLVGPDQLPGTEHFLVDADGDPIIAGKWQSTLQQNKLTGEARRAFDDTIAARAGGVRRARGRRRGGAGRIGWRGGVGADAHAAGDRLALLCRDADRQHHRQRLQGPAAVRPHGRGRNRAGGRSHAPAGAAADRRADPPPRRRGARLCRRQDAMRARPSIAPTTSAMSARLSTRWRTTSPTRIATSPRRSRSCSIATRRWSTPTAPSPTSSPT